MTDFGLARVTGDFATRLEPNSGTAAFTAPEVIAGAVPTATSDLYGLSATLFCALTGDAAFERRHDESMVAQILRVSKDPVPDLGEADIPDPVARVIERAMARAPADRPPSAAEFGASFVSSNAEWVMAALK